MWGIHIRRYVGWANSERVESVTMKMNRVSHGTTVIYYQLNNFVVTQLENVGTLLNIVIYML